MNIKIEKNAVLIAFIRMILLLFAVAATVTTTGDVDGSGRAVAAAAPIWSQSSDKLNDFMFWIAYLLSP